MADVQANITLITTGGTESAAEINKAGTALNGVTAASSGMESAFQRRFQHIGLMLFAGDALRASGLGMEARQIIGGLNVALMGVASTFGAAAAPVLLFVAAMAAIIGIGAKVIQHHQDEVVALNKVIASNAQALKSYEDEAKAIQDYITVIGRAPAGAKALLDADKAVADDIRGNQLTAYQQLITALNLKIAAEKDAAGVEVALASAVSKVQAAHMSLLTTLTQVGLWFQGKHFGESAEDIRKHKEAIDADTAALRKAEQAMRDLLSGNTKSWQDMTKAAQDAAKARQDAVDKENAHELAIMDYHVNKFVEAKQAEVAAHKKALDEQEKQAAHIFGLIGTDIGNAFAKSIVEGKNFTQELQAAFTHMAEQIIEQIIAIIVKQQLLYAWQTLTGTQGSGNIGGGGGGGGFGGMFPTGGSRMVDRPTLFMAGDAGPELATFTPVGGSGAATGSDSGGGGGIQIGTVQTIIQGVDDPNRIADQVGDKIIQRIRGMGELNFTR